MYNFEYFETKSSYMYDLFLTVVLPFQYLMLSEINIGSVHYSSVIVLAFIYILLTKRQGLTGRILAQNFDSMERVQQGPN